MYKLQALPETASTNNVGITFLGMTTLANTH